MVALTELPLNPSLTTFSDFLLLWLYLYFSNLIKLGRARVFGRGLTSYESTYFLPSTLYQYSISLLTITRQSSYSS